MLNSLTIFKKYIVIIQIIILCKNHTVLIIHPLYADLKVSLMLLIKSKSSIKSELKKKVRMALNIIFFSNQLIKKKKE